MEIKRKYPPEARKCLLYWDTFACHLSKDIEEKLKKNQIDIRFIPGGTTSLLYSLDFSVNKPIKGLVRK